MTESVTEREVIRSIRDHLPELLRSDPSLGNYILSVTREHFSPKEETEDRFTRTLNELARDREEQSRKWEENQREWKKQREEDKRKWEENQREWKKQREEDRRKWEEQNRKWEEQKEEDKRKWEENQREWKKQREEDKRKGEEQSRKWEENQREWKKQREEDERKWGVSNRRFEAMDTRIERAIGSLGARWGIESERAFRDALAAILVESFGVEVLNVNEFDDEGEVFGRPDQIELDVIIKNGLLILCELKSSMSKPDMHAFERKARFYERRHRRQANRKIVVSPMIDDRARRVGAELGIEMYPDSLDVPA